MKMEGDVELVETIIKLNNPDQMKILDIMEEAL